jgi:hypothetical protein
VIANPAQQTQLLLIGFQAQRAWYIPDLHEGEVRGGLRATNTNKRGYALIRRGTPPSSLSGRLYLRLNIEVYIYIVGMR